MEFDIFVNLRYLKWVCINFLPVMSVNCKSFSILYRLDKFRKFTTDLYVSFHVVLLHHYTGKVRQKQNL